jgi:glycine/D-amino acid oxidase-like deaminating enzyme
LFGALQIATDAQVDNRALTDALCAAATRAGAKLRERCAVRSLIISDGRARGVITEQGQSQADLDRAGLRRLDESRGRSEQRGAAAGTAREGQMAACEPPPCVTLPEALIWSDDVYLVPRQNRLFIGATVEEAGFDTSVTREACDWLLASAARVIPSLSGWRLAEMWAGLRPRTPDDAPVLGTTSIDRLLVAGGQFRNGILFAPLSRKPFPASFCRTIRVPTPAPSIRNASFRQVNRPRKLPDAERGVRLAPT